MFYCHDCREKNYYPESILKSYGKCEVCGVIGECNDVASKHLPTMQEVEKRNASKLRNWLEDLISND